MALALLLHYSPCYVASHPRRHVFVDLDHDEEDYAVDDDHAIDHTEIHPFRSVYVDLEDVFQDELTVYFHARRLAVEHQPLQIILVLSLKVGQTLVVMTKLCEFCKTEIHVHETVFP